MLYFASYLDILENILIHCEERLAKKKIEK